MRTYMQNVLLLKIVALLCVVVSGVLAWNLWQTFQNSVISYGEVISVETRSVRVNNDSSKLFYHPIVHFFDDTGARQTVIMQEGAQVRFFNNGDTVMLMYPHGAPQSAHIEDWWGLVSPLFVSMLVALLSGYFALVRNSEASDNPEGDSQA